MSEIHYRRIGRLREIMSEKGWDAVVFSGSDPHGSEYPASRWKQVEWLSGFTGEAGQLVVTQDQAGLWTDSRYFIQAAEELSDSGVSLHKTRVPGAVDIPEWLARHAGTVVLDGTVFTLSEVRKIEAAISDPVSDVPDLINMIWYDRPSLPCSPVITLDDETTGESRFQKIQWLRKVLIRESCDAILLTALDEIAWMLNVRGRDIEYNPLVLSYLLVTMDDVFWYARKADSDPDPDTADSFAEVTADGVTICGYEDLEADLPGIVAGLASGQDAPPRIFVDDTTLNFNVFKSVSESFGDENVIVRPSPVILRKAVKNSVEIQGIREAFLVDGIAVEKFLFWLDAALASGTAVTEHEASCRLTSFRSEIPGYRGDSFRNISAYGTNAALPHYSTPEQGSAVIERRGLYLVDSGGQYIFGTTDITRTVPVGECSALEREDYTLVLKGMIALAMAVFPKGTPGCRLDALARMPLWKSRRNFGHGTGHGIGFYLCVHEGPQDIRQNLSSQALLPGMVTSDEPGIYREGMHGVRHENILLCADDMTNSFGEWLRFETLTLCHIDTGPVVRGLMTQEELEWLNAYNRHVCETLSPFLEPEVVLWLKEKTRPL